MLKYDQSNNISEVTVYHVTRHIFSFFYLSFVLKLFKKEPTLLPI